MKPTVHLREVRLRAVTLADRAFLEHLASPAVAGPFNLFIDPPQERMTAADVGAGAFLAELDDGTPIGDLSWFGVPYGPNRRSLAWRIGCTIDVPFRRRGYGSRAQRLLADHLLRTTGSARVEADTDVENVAEQRALVRAGFRREATLRSAQYRAGTWHDLVLYSRVQADLG